MPNEKSICHTNKKIYTILFSLNEHISQGDTKHYIMNKTLVYCDILRIDASYLTAWPTITLTVINVIIMVGSIIANSLVTYILIKTKQLSFASCRLIFMLSLSDLLTGVLAQNLLFTVINGTSCFINLIFSLQYSSQMYLVTQLP